MSELGFRTRSRVRQRRFGGCLAVLLALAVLGGGGFVVAWKGQEVLAGVFVTPDYDGPGEGEVDVQVREGQSASAIAETLEEADVVKSASAFTRAARRDERSRAIQPGHYVLRQKMSGDQALAMLLDPNSRVYEQVTIPEGLRASDAVAWLSSETGLEETRFSDVLDDPAELSLPAYAKDDIEGFLFPATYNVEPDATAAQILEQMVLRFDQAAQELKLIDRAERVNRSAREVVIIASLIEKEARNPEDFPRVARVIYNRLAEDMRLEFDSTVHYALDESGRISTSRKDRQTDSAYNTYQHKGLPPGPIAAPGERALEAALEPADGDWLYFVTTNPDTGETKFSTTYSEHQEYAKEFNQWCRDNKDRC